MFDVGFTELLLLAVIGLLVLGPERLPKVARTLGGLTRKARSSWLNLKRSIDAEINAEEIKKPIQKMRDDVRSAVDGVDKQLKKTTASVNEKLAGKPSDPKPSDPTHSDPTHSDPKPSDHANN
jgi:sec-independent protein translocase protein TatB